MTLEILGVKEFFGGCGGAAAGAIVGAPIMLSAGAGAATVLVNRIVQKYWAENSFLSYIQSATLAYAAMTLLELAPFHPALFIPGAIAAIATYVINSRPPQWQTEFQTKYAGWTGGDLNVDDPTNGVHFKFKRSTHPAGDAPTFSIVYTQNGAGNVKEWIEMWLHAQPGLENAVVKEVVLIAAIV